MKTLNDYLSIVEVCQLRWLLSEISKDETSPAKAELASLLHDKIDKYIDKKAEELDSAIEKAFCNSTK